MLKIDVPINDADMQSVVQEQAEQLSIPSATYASIQVKNEHVHIAETHGDNVVTHGQALSPNDAETEVLNWLEQASQLHHLQFIAAAFQKEDRLKDMVSKLWLREDIVPFPLGRQDTSCQHSIEEQVRNIRAYFNEDNIVYPQISADQEVRVAELVTLEDYRRVTPERDFALVGRLARAFEGKRLDFISATPQGGGVALMRHALIRLLRLLHVDAHWYVLIPKKEAFDITKPKFHNVLQAVASPDTVLTEEDKGIYEVWMRENAIAFQSIFEQSDVIVIDDPQPSGLIPYIKQANPETKIIYRSHIQIVGSQASLAGTPQHTTWSYLWNNIQHSDYFISHPMKMFIPDAVPAEKIFYMPATTDPLDGLNKPLTERQMSTYLELFNALLLQNGQTPLDQTRPYIIQVARFDPSKGIPDVLEAYSKLRSMLEEQHKPMPQLVITGNASVDDPDGVRIYGLVMSMLQTDPYVHFVDDIKVVRLPHKDQILNTLMRKSAVALQLSIKEGFEVKVTEALMKGVPIIAYNVGGIPLQIEDGINGHLVEVGNTTLVARHLYDLLTDKNHYQHMSAAAYELAGRDYLTIPNAICWLYLALTLVNDEKLEGHYQWVKALAEKSSCSKS